ncbi:MAG: 3-oxoacyl-[acyl-carrier-protein] reductase [Candidatus Onthomorpha sp.]|nr:3-oxoacyl-[acyl-carrier-protein] reductase [Bacteroidales bacterium]MDY4584873.1 3-oxoacyl-[acyl-carrier-protein] reductase [Candidatus Onthomorpha sp.]MCI5716462.1 3-oxoacyl-[acyl-carrier-protein] reductase [Bacteroidales bacterium]MCI6416508.1 3-oxoacyl-[acyl-carrier-protein] reductase [Bacteroidales bacterium]MCI6645655.1 3-oxoacyl-[acyl-carrier-protein] reductase [Bacteroidales bacterium]
MKRLENKVAIITGGTAGIGAAAAKKFAQEGAKVTVWARNAEKGKAFVEAMAKEGYTICFDAVDTSNYEQVVAATKRVFDANGKIDILINNAGITNDSTLKKMTPEQWQSVIDINLTGTFYCTKAVNQYMVEAGWGRIINVSSVVGLYGNFGQTNYVATKAGVIGMTKTLCRELGKKGVTVNAVAPGFIATDMVAKMPEDVLAGMVAKVPVGRLGKPEDIANAFCFLASDEAAYVNGAVLSVDGGMTV